MPRTAVPQNRQQRRQAERIAAAVEARTVLATQEAGRAPRSGAPGVAVAYLHPGQVAGAFCDSLSGLLIHDSMGPGHIVGPNGGGTIAMASGPRVAEARSQLVDTFLGNSTFEHAEYLLMLDSDMTFQPDLVDRLVATSKRTEADVVGGLCFAGGHSRMYPTLYRIWRDDAGRLDMEPVEDYPRDSLVKVHATGAACILIRRRTLLAMRRPHPHGFGTHPDGTPNAYPWFVEGGVLADGRPLGEDIAFCQRIGAMGGTIFVDTSVKLGHVKTTELNEALWEAGRVTVSGDDPTLPTEAVLEPAP